MDESTSSSNDHSTGDGYAYKNEISLSIGEDDHNSGTNSTAVPTPSPRHVEIPVPGDDSEYASLKDHNGSATMNGLDNPAFESDKEKRPLSSFGHSGEKSLGATSVNGKVAAEKPLAEAVNLELLNMSKPSNGHKNGASALPVKKDTEVDIGDPYDEYFVPVNEHRKFMR